MPPGAAKTAIRIILGLALVAGAAIALVPQLGRTDSGRHLVERFLSRRLGFEVSVEELRIGYDLSLWVRGLSAHGPASEPFLTAENARLTLRPSLESGLAVRAETYSPHVYVDRLPPARAGEAEPKKPTPGADEIWLPRLDVDVRDGFVHQGDRTLGPIEVRFAPEPASGAGQLKVTTRMGAPENEIRWTIDPRLAERRAVVAAEGEIADLPAVLRAAALATTGPLSGKAAVRLDGEVFWDREGKGTAKGRLLLDGLEGHDEEQTRALKGVSASASIQANYASGVDPRAEIDLAIAAGEVLWDRFYLNLAQNGVKARISGRRDGRAFRFEKTTLALAGLATAEASGAYDPDGRKSLESSVEVADLSSLYRVAIQEPFRELHPSLAESSLKGRLRARVSYLGSAGKARVTGKVEILGGAIDASDPELVARNLELNLPFQIGTGAAGAKGEQGFVRAAELSLGGVRIADIDLDLTAEPDAITLEHPVRLAVLGGLLDLNHFSAVRLGDPERYATLGVSLHALDLGELSRALGGPPFSGKISGAIPDIRAGDGRIMSQGQIDIDAFDGTIAVRGLRLDQVLSPVPELTLDAAFENVSLGRLTQELEVGKVSGVARGGVEDLVMTRGEPVRFD
ncbi:MAG TPA: hypothetical protein VLF14_04975, partial [Candidatus Binatia bacterium]|nr:hypothetical protein [Candidatus Binatia bacterium]